MVSNTEGLVRSRALVNRLTSSFRADVKLWLSGVLLALIVWWGVGLYGTAIEPADQDQVGGDPIEQPAEETPTQPEPDAAPAGPAPQ